MKTYAINNKGAPRGGGRTAGFTLIELLVSMAILVVIMLIVSLVFQRASVVWDTGMRKAELDMTGRGVADFMAQELSMAMPGPPFSVSGAAATFSILGDADATNGAVRSVAYVGSAPVTRNGDVLAEGVTVNFITIPPSASLSAGELPVYADVTVTLTNNYGENIKYQSRAFFMNRGRNRL